MDIYRKNDWLGNKNTLHLNQSNLWTLQQKGNCKWKG